ncbi:O-antigen ligase family protein [Hoeflea sp. YIM 152468]|uniref:O-antigen ligase family protein n=1 Tax=Hoeflea sp. YIM 152468 TaxID=3031759 RepID=UPI0023DA6655|nr:O-antigen ligase family protein [Hoeflea sp. YIM 152468]MDF1608883.1 O-antigen ligase family protein [Hoeflea sp. YIM 152468]
MKKFFLMRRRMDGLFFLLAAFMLMLPTDTSTVVFGTFLGIGIYLLVFKPKKSLSHVDKTYLVVTLGFSASSLLINLLNGSLPGDLRWSSYPLYYSLVIPIAIGAVLVRDPLRQFVIGTRAALVVLALWALFETITAPGRLGFGSNPANAAFAISFLAVVSRLNIRSAPWLLANRYLFFYLGFITVVASQTRAVLPVFLLAIALDGFQLMLRHRGPGSWLGNRRNIVISGVVLALCLSSIWIIYPSYAERIQSSIKEISLAFQPKPSDTVDAFGHLGMSIRFAQWRGALELIAENPVLGRGGTGISEAIITHTSQDTSPDLREYTFVHNFILDETIQRGLAGLALLIGYFGFCFGRIYRYGDSSMRENVLLILVLTFSFGLLHYLLVIDRHVILYAFYFLLLTTANHQAGRTGSSIAAAG